MREIHHFIMLMLPKILIVAIVFSASLLPVQSQEVSTAQVSEAVPTAEQQAEESFAQRRHRLESHMQVFQRWLHRICNLTADQQRDLRELCDEEIRLSQTSWKNDPNDKPLPLLPDFAPIEFTNIAGAADRLFRPRFRQKLPHLLTLSQMSVFNDVDDRRIDRLQSDDINYHLAVIDQELRLSEQQWVELEWWMTMRDRIPAVRHAAGSQLLSLHTIQGPLRMEPNRAVTLRLHELDLTLYQRNRMKALSRVPERPAQLKFVHTTGGGLLHEELQVILNQFRERSSAELELELPRLQKEWRLSDDQVSYLRLAGRGAAIKYLEQWKDTNAEAIRRAGIERENVLRNVRIQAARAEEQRLLLLRARGVADHLQPNFPEAVQKVKLTLPAFSQADVFQHPVWIRALESLRPGEGAFDDVNRERRRQAIAGFVMANLDRELWLMPEQREQLAPLVAESLPDAMDELREPGRELVWLVMPLLRIEREPLEQILDEAQLTAWDLLKQQYHVQNAKIGEDRKISVMLTSGTPFQAAIPD